MMIQCRECDHRISNSAPACPQCGAPTPGGKCKLVFSRPSFYGAAVSLEVLVDGMPYGSLGVRKKIEVPVSPGDHHVEVIPSRGASRVTSVSAAAGETLIKVGTGFLRPSITVDDQVTA